MSFSERLIKAFRRIYVNSCNTLRFLAEVSTKLQKMHFLDNIRTITQKGSTETRQMTSFFYQFVIFIFLFENGLNLFSCGSFFGLFWSAKYLNFQQKLPIWTTHHICLESRQPEVIKVHIMFCPPRGAKKKVSSYGLIPVVLSCLYPLFQIQSHTFCCPLFTKNCLNPQVRINRIVNKHTANYQLSYF